MIGVDGGGTGCRVRLTDSRGQVLGEATGGPANITTDFEAARRNIEETIADAFHSAGRAPDGPKNIVAWLGLAGAGPADFAHRMERALGYAHVRVTTDCATVTQGALGDGDGVVALVGTGSFFLRRENGQDRRIGGWGYQLGDEAGGAWLGREMLRRVLHAHDGLCAHSPLSRTLLKEHDNSPDKLVLFAQDAQPGMIATLAPRISAAQAQGDALAREVIAAGLDEICRRLDALGPDAPATAPLYLLGGLAQVYAPLLPAPHRARLHPARGSALDGAVHLARRHLLPETGGGARDERS